MESRKLAALLCSLISQILLLLFHLFPSSSPPLSLSSNSHPNSSPCGNTFPLLITHLLFSHEIAASLSLLPFSRKRKRTHLPESDESDKEEKGEKREKELGRVKPSLTQTPDSFRNSFNMTSSTFQWLSGLLEPLLECRDPPGSNIDLSSELRLGIGLFHLSTGADYPKISVQFNVSESVARFCSKQLCRVLCTNFRFWVTFPGPGQLRSIALDFENLTGLPNCCGVIDCTRFKHMDHSHSIAAQIVVDSSSRILSIVAGFRDDKHDPAVLMSSTLYKDIEGGRVLNSSPVYINGITVDQYLIGSRKYPLLSWLITPFTGREALQGSSEDNFNRAHDKMRLSAVRAVNSLRNWGVLSCPISEEYKTGVGYIGACSILHNALLMRDDCSALSDDLSSLYLGGGYELEDGSVSEKGSVIRSVLATRAKPVL